MKTVRQHIYTSINISFEELFSPKLTKTVSCNDCMEKTNVYISLDARYELFIRYRDFIAVLSPLGVSKPNMAASCFQVDSRNMFCES